MSNEEDTYLTIQEAADHIDVSPRTIRRRITDGTLTGYVLGRDRKTKMVKVKDVESLNRPME